MILVSPVVMDGQLTVHLVSDYLKPVRGKFTLKVMDMEGNIIYSKAEATQTPVNSSELIFKSDIKKISGNASFNDIIIYTEFQTPNKTYTNIAYTAEQKFMNYRPANMKWKIKKINDGYELLLTSEVFARGVFLSLPGINSFFEDNYFDLLPHSPKVIKLRSSKTLNEIDQQIKVTSLVDSYN